MQIHGSFSETQMQTPAEVDLSLDFGVNVYKV